jgi:replicative DNA helicase
MSTPPRPGIRLLPHALDVEESLLGAMLLSRDAIEHALDLTPTDFHKPSHGITFETIKKLYATGVPIDQITVSEELRRTGQYELVGGTETLINLQYATPSTSNAPNYVNIIRDYAKQRRLVLVGNEITELGYTPSTDIDATLDAAETLLYQATEIGTTSPTALVGDTLAAMLNDLEQRYETGDTMSGVPTGCIDLDNVLHGLRPGELIIIGGRPGMGKSIVGLSIARHIAVEQRLPALFCSLEMSNQETNYRLVSQLAKVPHDHYRTGRLNDTEWAATTNAITRLADAPLLLNDDPTLTVLKLRAEARRAIQRHRGLSVVVVDYLQLMTSKGAENRQLEIAEIARSLKILARDIGVPIIALSQLSRNLEQRADKRPQLSDLRESGEIENSADVVILTYRDDYYHPTDSTQKGLVELSIAKHRAGPTATIHMAFLGQYMRIDNLANSKPTY